MPDETRVARPEPMPPLDEQLLLPLGGREVERPPRTKVYRDGFQITVRHSGVLIVTVDYHARRLFLDTVALRQLGLGLQLDGGQEWVGTAKQES